MFVCLDRPHQVTDWGWKMTVTPVMDKTNALNLPPAMLDSKMASLLRICRDCPKEQVPKKKWRLLDGCEIFAYTGTTVPWNIMNI